MIDRLFHLRDSYLERAHVPYSGRPDAAVVLLSDGSWVPGVRVENASFSLSMKAAVNAVTTAVAAGRTDVVAVLGGEPGLPEYLAGVMGGAWRWETGTLAVRSDRSVLPPAGDVIDLFVEVNPGGPLDAARRVSARAHTPESDFPVGSVLDLGNGLGIPGVNVEHPDWSGIVCAERNALGTWITLGRPGLYGLHLTCPHDPTGTPCGACRQWLVELVPELPVAMDRGDASPEILRADSLLPGAFTGRSLRPKT